MIRASQPRYDRATIRRFHAEVRLQLINRDYRTDSGFVMFASAGTEYFLVTGPIARRASPFAFAGPQGLVAPALLFHDLSLIDTVVISHHHYDQDDR